MKEFLEDISNAAKEFKKRNQGCIGILSHNDTDGITSAAIISKALERLNQKFHISIITRLSKEEANNKIKLKDYKTWLLLDYGGKEAKDLAKAHPDKFFIILDHHLTDGIKIKHKNIICLDPSLYGIDGGKDVCAASICYLFTEALSPENLDLLPLAIVGMTGDSQIPPTSINKELLDKAIKHKLIEIKKGLKFYGWTSRPIQKALEYSTEPYIPGISGSESKAVEFLQELDINPKKEDGSWKTFLDLTEDEKKKLASAIILKRHKAKDAQEVFGDKIFITNPKISEFREVEIFSAYLNSCAKQNQFGIAIATALGDQEAYEASKQLVIKYRSSLLNAMSYFYDNQENKDTVLKTEKAIYFLGKDNLDTNIVSTVCTILSHNLEEQGKPIFCFSYIKDTNKMKVSSRIIGENTKNMNLGKINKKIAEELGGIGGGHAPAAACTVPKKEENFIKLVEQSIK